MTSNWFTDAGKILMSDPSAITALAGQWDDIAMKIPDIKTETLDPALVTAASSWTTGGNALNAYGQQLGDQLAMLASTAHQIATGLNSYASLLAKARADVILLAITAIVAAGTTGFVLFGAGAVAAAGIETTEAALAAWVRPAGMTAEGLSVLASVRSYLDYAHGLGGTFGEVTQQVAELNKIGAIGATMPTLPATPN